MFGLGTEPFLSGLGMKHCLSELGMENCPIWVGMEHFLIVWVGNGTLVVWDQNGLLMVWVGNGTLMVWVCVRTEAERKLMMEERMELEEYQRKQNKIREEELEVRIGETLRNILFLRLKHKNCM